MDLNLDNMAQKTKAQLVAEIDAIYVNCGTECITPEEVNTFEKDKTDSYAILNENNNFSGVATWTKQIREHKGANITAGSALTLTNDGNYFHVSGSSTVINSITTRQHGTRISLYFNQDQTLTHSSNLVLPNAADYQAKQGEILQFVSEGSGVWRFISGSYQGLVSAYTTVTKSAFDALVAASALVPGTWYYVTDCTSPVWGDVAILCIANSVSTVNSELAYLDYGSNVSLLQGVIESLTDLNSFIVYAGWIILSPTQAAEYSSGFTGGVSVLIGAQYRCNVADDGSGISRYGVQRINDGVFGSLSPDFTTFYPYSGQYNPTITSDFESVLHLASSYSIQGNILTSVHELEMVAPTAPIAAGHISIEPPSGITISSSSGNNCKGTWSFAEPQLYSTIERVKIAQVDGQIRITFSFDTAPVGFTLYLVVQSLLA